MYGTKGIPSIDNNPGIRDSASMVLDSIKKKIYLFGGYYSGGTSNARVLVIYRFRHPK